ncbi:MAG: ABC transporter substrate-binding protein, partial [Candidatus Nanopelagicales bacterium]
MAGGLSATLLLGACTAAPAENNDGTAPEEIGTTLVTSWSAPVANLDPHNIVPGTGTSRAAINTYESLGTYIWTENADGSLVAGVADVAPGLAESWDFGDDGTVTFHLREDAVFYPSGNPVTAEDVQYSLDRTFNHPSKFGLVSLQVMGIADPAQGTVVDEHTWQVQLLGAGGVPLNLNNELSTLFAGTSLLIVDSKVAQEHATADDPWATEYLADNTIGSAPYYVESYSDVEVKFAAVPDYYRGAPYFTEVIARVTGATEVPALIRNGDVGLVENALSTSQLDDLDAAGFTVVSAANSNYLFLDLDMTDERLGDPLVRQAIAYAMPYDAINQVVFSGRTERSLSFVSPGATAFSPAWDRYDEDLAKAKSLVEQAGATGLTIPVFYDNSTAYMEDVALLIQQNLAEAGITLELNGQTNTQFTEERAKKMAGEASQQSGFLLWQGQNFVDEPAPIVSNWFTMAGRRNWSRYDNAQVAALHGEFANSADAKARTDAYAEIQAIIADDLPRVPLVILNG